MRVAALALLVLAACAAAQTCDNPLFRPGTNSGPLLPQPTNAVDFPADGKSCTFFAGKKSCCTAQTLTAIGNVAGNVTKVLDDAEAEVQKVRDDVDAVVKQAVDGFICNAQISQLNCGADEKNQLSAALKDLLLSALTLADAGINCGRGYLGYRQGLTCLACAADWKQYITQDGQGLVSKIKLATSTCDGMAAACTPVNDAYEGLKPKIKSFLLAAIDIIDSNNQRPGGVSIPRSQVEQLELPSVCDATGTPECRDLICKAVMNGFGTRLRLSALASAAGGLRGGSSSTLETLEGSSLALLAHFHASINPAASARKLSHAQLKTHVATIADKLMNLQALPSGSTIIDGSAEMNTYASDGYPAYQIGCADTGQCPSSSPAGAIVGVLVALIVVGAIAFVVIRRQRNSRNVAMPGGSAPMMSSYSGSASPAGYAMKSGPPASSAGAAPSFLTSPAPAGGMYASTGAPAGGMYASTGAPAGGDMYASGASAGYAAPAPAGGMYASTGAPAGGMYASTGAPAGGMYASTGAPAGGMYASSGAPPPAYM